MAASWTITGQAPDQFEFDGAGNPVSGYRVSFLTGNGNKGSVFVPEVHYEAATVRRLVAAQANRMDEVGSLSSGG